MECQNVPLSFHFVFPEAKCEIFSRSRTSETRSRHPCRLHNTHWPMATILWSGVDKCNLFGAQMQERRCRKTPPSDTKVSDVRLSAVCCVNQAANYVLMGRLISSGGKLWSQMIARANTNLTMTRNIDTRCSLRWSIFRHHQTQALSIAN